jgi:hypothetical protein
VGAAGSGAPQFLRVSSGRNQGRAAPWPRVGHGGAGGRPSSAASSSSPSYSGYDRSVFFGLRRDLQSDPHVPLSAMFFYLFCWWYVTRRAAWAMASDGHSAALIGMSPSMSTSRIAHRSLGGSLPYWELAGNWLTPLRASIIVETEFPAEHTCLQRLPRCWLLYWSTESLKLSSVAGIRELEHAEGQCMWAFFSIVRNRLFAIKKYRVPWDECDARCRWYGVVSVVTICLIKLHKNSEAPTIYRYAH